MKWLGKSHEGKYRPILSVELFHQVQTILKVRSKPRLTRKRHQFPFCGIFHCSCHSMISAQWAKGRGCVYRYYRCSRKTGGCREPYLAEGQVREQVLGLLSPLALTASDATQIFALIDCEADKECEAYNSAFSVLQAKFEPL
jgi:hypothetical protein